MNKTPTFRDDNWMEHFEEHFIKPIGEMFADPAKYAAYRASVEEGMKHPAEVKRRADVDAMFARIAEQQRRDEMLALMD